MTPSPFTLLLDGCAFLESPRWRDGCLWLSDFFGHRVLIVDRDGCARSVVGVPTQPSGLGWLPDGRLLVVSMRDRRVLRREHDGTLVEHADLASFAGGPCNDMVVDGQGRAWVGNFGFDLAGGDPPQPTVLVRVDPDGRAQVVAERLWFPNGSVVTPDGATLIVGESYAARLSAFAIRPNGTLAERRVWARFERPPSVAGAHDASLPVAPDGCCLDAEGALWIADANGRRVLRVREGGMIVQQIRTDPMGAYACMLGGDDGRTLFVCVAPDFDEKARRAARDSQVWTVRVGVPHAGWP